MMEVNSSKSTTSLEERTRKNLKRMVPCLKRTCLSAESALTGRPNVEDVPLGAKLPMIPGNKLQLYTTNLCEKLHLPSCDFDRTYPSDVYVSNEYRCLHDPHLKGFFVERPTMRKRLHKNDFITPEKKVVCSLKEYNLYRQYLKHLSIEYLNKKYSEQYEKEYDKIKEETKRIIMEKQQDDDNPITKRFERAREARRVMEKETERRRRHILRKMQEYTEKRETERREERLRRMIEEEIRERTRENRKQEKAAKEVQENFMRRQILNLKLREDLHRRKTFEEKIKRERKDKERILIEKYEKKKQFHHMKIQLLKKVLADEEMRRKARVTDMENHFNTRHKTLLSALESLKEKDRKARDKRNETIELRLKARGWTGAACRRKSNIPPRKKSATKGATSTFYGYGDGSKMAKAQIVRQLSAMGFHNVMMTPDLLKGVWNIGDGEEVERSSGDAALVRRTLSQQANQFCVEVVKHGYASEYVRHVIEVAQELQEKSEDLVTQVIDVSKNVLFPMLQSYEKKTGVTVTTAEIPETLRDLSAGVFDEEEDYLPQIFSFHDGGKTTMHAGSKDSNVRFVVSQSDIPMELKARRPPTPKRVRFSSSSDSSDESELSEIGSDSNLLLEETIRQLSEKVVHQVFVNCDLVQPEITKDEMHERINDMAKSIIDEVILFGTEEKKESSSTSSVSSSSEDSSGFSLEEKISHLAKQLITDVVDDIKETPRSSSTTSMTSTGSSMSVLALRVVTSILGTVDPTTGKTIRDHAASCEGLEEKVANLSAKVVEEIIREKNRKSPRGKVDQQGFAELEEKISKLALNIVTNTMKGKRPESSITLSSLCSAEVEEKVLDFSARIIGGIIRLKQLIPKDRKKSDVLRLKPASSVERVVREIFNVEALEDAPDTILKNATARDVQKITYGIAQRLVPPRDDSSAISSGLSQLAAAMGENAVIRAGDSNISTVGSSMEDAVNTLADVVVGKAMYNRKILSDESKISSAISEVADTMIEEALARGDVAGRMFSSSESKLSSAISDIAQAITQSALDQQTSTQSAISSGASKLAGAITGEAVSRVAGGALESSTSSAMESGISDVATKAVEETMKQAQIIDSSTRSAISPGIKTLAEKVAQQVLDIAAADPEGLGSSTRSAISSGTNQLAAQIASMLTGQGSISTSTLESVLSSAVSDIVSEMLTQQVLNHVSESVSEISSQSLAGEVERMVQNILGIKTGESKLSKTSIESKVSYGPSTSSALESGVSDLACDVIKELLSSNDSRERVTDESASSAISAVAARYVHQVLGIPISDETQDEVIEDIVVPTQVISIAAVPPRRPSENRVERGRSNLNQRSSSMAHMPQPPKIDKPNGRKVRHQLKGMSTGNLQEQANQRRRQTTTSSFASSFSDWRSSKAGKLPAHLKGKSLSSLKEIEERTIALNSQTQFAGDFGKMRTSSEEFNNIMDSLATRIVTSVVVHREGEGEDSEIGQELISSQSVEQLVGTLALGVVTSLLGLDVLNSASSTEPVVDELENDSNEERLDDENAPGPSAGHTGAQNTELTPLIPEKSDEDSHKHAKATEECPKILSILCSEDGTDDWKKPSYQTPCHDNAAEHPHRVMSPTRKDREAARGIKPRKYHGKGYPRVSGWFSSKFPRKQSTPKSDSCSVYEKNPLKHSAGFVDRRWLTNSKSIRQSEVEVSLKPKQFSRNQTSSLFSSTGHKADASAYSIL